MAWTRSRLGWRTRVDPFSSRRSTDRHRPRRTCSAAKRQYRTAGGRRQLPPSPAPPSRLSFEQVPRARRVELDARAHRRGDVDALDVLALGGRRLGADDLVEHGAVVLHQHLLGERLLADAQVDDAGAVGAVLDLAALGVADGLADVERDGAGLGVRHEAARTEDAAELADRAHHVRRRDGDVEVEDALLDLLGEVVGADDVGAGLLGLARLVALGEHGDAHLLAGAVRQHGGAAHDLVGVAHVDAETEVDLDGLVELGALERLEQAHALERGVETTGFDAALGGGVGAALAWPCAYLLWCRRRPGRLPRRRPVGGSRTGLFRL